MTLNELKFTHLAVARFRHWGTLAAFVFTIGTALGQTSYVYLESNIGQTNDLNSVYAYKNDGFGNLTPVAGSPPSDWRDRGVRPGRRRSISL